MLFDTLKMSCEKLAEKDGEFKFLLQSFIKEHSSVNGLVNMDIVKSLYDMILDHARSYVVVNPVVNKAVIDKTKASGCFNFGSADHWCADCPHPKKDDQNNGKGQSSKPGPSGSQPIAKGKSKGQSKGQSTGQTAGGAKGKGKSKGK